MNKFDSINEDGPAETKGAFPFWMIRAMLVSTVSISAVFRVEGVVAVHDCSVIWERPKKPLSMHSYWYDLVWKIGQDLCTCRIWYSECLGPAHQAVSPCTFRTFHRQASQIEILSGGSSSWISSQNWYLRSKRPGYFKLKFRSMPSLSPAHFMHKL